MTEKSKKKKEKNEEKKKEKNDANFQLIKLKKKVNLCYVNLFLK